MNKTTDIVLPHAPDVEKSIVGALISDDMARKEIFGHIQGDAFYAAKNRVIFETVYEMHTAGVPIDLITLSERLTTENKLEQVGGEPYLVDLLGNIATTWNVKYYAQILNEKKARRRVITACAAISGQAFHEEIGIGGLNTMINDLGGSMDQLCEEAGSEKGRVGQLVSVDAVKDSVLTYYKDGFRNVGVDPGWVNLAEHYRPAKGTLNIVTGIPSHGKSEFVDALMINLALKYGWKWAVFSPENYPYELHVQKLVEKATGKPMFGNNRMPIEELLSTTDWLNNQFVFMEPHEGNLSLDAILDLAKKAVEQHGVDGICLDPWNEMTVDLKRNESETDYIGRALMRCRRFARKYNVAFYIVAHPAKLNKNLKTGKYDPPRLYDISGSAHWNNKSDVGITVFRDFVKDQVDIHILKVRFKVHGKVGVVTMKYVRESGRFVEVYEPSDV